MTKLSGQAKLDLAIESLFNEPRGFLTDGFLRWHMQCGMLQEHRKESIRIVRDRGMTILLTGTYSDIEKGILEHYYGIDWRDVETGVYGITVEKLPEIIADYRSIPTYGGR
jgi:hypothetical protein